MQSHKLLLAALIGVAAPLSFAHGTWVAQRVGEPTIVYGEGDRDDAYSPDKLVYLQAFDTMAQPLDIPLNKHEKNISFGTGAEFGSVAYVLDNGYWTEQEDGEWVNKPKDEVNNAKRSGHYVKTAFNVMESGKLPELSALKELPLVILPDSDVLDTKPGDEIEVTVYYEGKPLADAKIENDFVNAEGKVVAETDKDGKAKIEVRNHGLNVIAVAHTVDAPADQQSKGEKLGYVATLSFSNYHEDH